jgi:hypothetical protein
MRTSGGRLLTAVVAASIALTSWSATSRAEKKADNSLETDLFQLQWGAGLSVLRYRGERSALCRPDPCIVGRMEFVPISPAAWIYLEPAGLRIGAVQLLDLAFMAGLTVKDELSDVRDLYTGIGLGLLNRYLVIGISVDLWRKTEEPLLDGNSSIGPSSGLLEGRAKGPGGFRWTENAGFFFALDFTNILGKGKDGAKQAPSPAAAAQETAEEAAKP